MAEVAGVSHSVVNHGDLAHLFDHERCEACIKRNTKCVITDEDEKCQICIGAQTECVFERQVVIRGPRQLFSWDILVSRIRILDVEILKRVRALVRWKKMQRLLYTSAAFRKALVWHQNGAVERDERVSQVHDGFRNDQRLSGPRLVDEMCPNSHQDELEIEHLDSRSYLERWRHLQSCNAVNSRPSLDDRTPTNPYKRARKEIGTAGTRSATNPWTQQSRSLPVSVAMEKDSIELPFVSIFEDLHDSAPVPGSPDASFHAASGPGPLHASHSRKSSVPQPVKTTQYRDYDDPRHMCRQCNDHPQGFRGPHELRRHIERVHNSKRTVWVCQDISPDKKFLSGCKACDSSKRYNAYYNAAEHLRRKHFNPRPHTTRSGRISDIPRRGGEIVGPSLEELKRWMVAIEIDG